MGKFVAQKPEARKAAAATAVEEPEVQNENTTANGLKYMPMPEKPQTVKAEQAPLMTTYRDLIDKVGGYKDRTEELERQRKRELSNRTLYKIFDGLNALSNLYAVTKGAPNSHNPKADLSLRARDRLDKIDAQRKANETAYQSAYKNGYAQDLADRASRQSALDRLAEAENRMNLAAYNQQAKAVQSHNAAVNRMLYGEQQAGYRQEENKLKNKYAKDQIVLRGQQNRLVKATPPGKAPSNGNSGKQDIKPGSGNGNGTLLPN